MMILDTDFLIDLTKGNQKAVEKLNSIANETLAISTISLTELYYGIIKQSKDMEDAQKFENYFILPFGLMEARIASELRVQLEKNGGRIGAMDEMIAATAIANGATLLTRNIRHFKRVKGLKLDTW